MKFHVKNMAFISCLDSDSSILATSLEEESPDGMTDRKRSGIFIMSDLCVKLSTMDFTIPQTRANECECQIFSNETHIINEEAITCATFNLKGAV